MVSQKLYRGCPQPPQTYKGSFYLLSMDLCVGKSTIKAHAIFNLAKAFIFHWAFCISSVHCFKVNEQNWSKLSQVSTARCSCAQSQTEICLSQPHIRRTVDPPHWLTPLRVSLLPTVSLDVGIVHLSILSEPAHYGIACPTWALTDLCVCACVQMHAHVYVYRSGEEYVWHMSMPKAKHQSPIIITQSPIVCSSIGAFWMLEAFG